MQADIQQNESKPSWMIVGVTSQRSVADKSVVGSDFDPAFLTWLFEKAEKISTAPVPAPVVEPETTKRKLEPAPEQANKKPVPSGPRNLADRLGPPRQMQVRGVARQPRPPSFPQVQPGMSGPGMGRLMVSGLIAKSSSTIFASLSTTIPCFRTPATGSAGDDGSNDGYADGDGSNGRDDAAHGGGESTPSDCQLMSGTERCTPRCSFTCTSSRPSTTCQTTPWDKTRQSRRLNSDPHSTHLETDLYGFVQILCRMYQPSMSFLTSQSSCR